MINWKPIAIGKESGYLFSQWGVIWREGFLEIYLGDTCITVYWLGWKIVEF